MLHRSSKIWRISERSNEKTTATFSEQEIGLPSVLLYYLRHTVCSGYMHATENGDYICTNIYTTLFAAKGHSIIQINNK